MPANPPPPAVISTLVPRRRPPIIGWAALIALLIFLPAEIYVGWDIARARASGPPFVVSYLMGRIIGALLISTLIAWFFYRVFRRSTRAGTIAFSLVLAVGLISEINQRHVETAHRAAAAKVVAESNVDPLRFGEQPTEIFRGAARINYPAIMGMFPDPRSREGFGLGLRDGNEPAFDAIVQLLPVPESDGLKASEDRLAAGLDEKLKLADPLVWNEIEGDRPRAITSVVADREDEGHGVVWGLVRLDPQRLVLINFRIYPKDPTQRAMFADIARRIVQSVTPSATPTTRAESPSN